MNASGVEFMATEGDVALGCSTQHNMQMMYHRIVHLNLNNFVNQCYLNKLFLKNEKTTSKK